MAIKASVTYMRNLHTGLIKPSDVIQELAFPIPGVQHMREAVALVRAMVPKAVPDGTKQINIVIWEDLKGAVT